MRELVRYGIRAADDATIRDSIRVVDASLKVDTPCGTCWRRYNNDGYGQREDGGPFAGSGKGRGWPLLTGERGPYEVASGRDASQYFRWLEGFATPTHLLPEQVWDEDDRPEQHLKRGRPTGSAVPLLWAHAEYIKLLRSVREGRAFDSIPEVADRYIRNRSILNNVQVWSVQHPSGSVQRGRTLRILSENAFEASGATSRFRTTSRVRFPLRFSGRTRAPGKITSLKSLVRNKYASVAMTFRLLSLAGSVAAAPQRLVQGQILGASGDLPSFEVATPINDRQAQSPKIPPSFMCQA